MEAVNWFLGREVGIMNNDLAGLVLEVPDGNQANVLYALYTKYTGSFWHLVVTLSVALMVVSIPICRLNEWQWIDG